MPSKFMSHADCFQDDYSIVDRSRSREFNAGFHYHDFYEIQIYMSDIPNDEVGTLLMGDNMYPVHDGDMVIINMFDGHYINMKKDVDYNRLCFSVSPALMMYVCNEKSNIFNIFKKNNPQYPCMHMQKTEFEEIKTNYEYFKKKMAEISHGKRFFEEAFLFNVIGTAYNLFFYEEDTSSTDSLHMNIMTTLIQYINSHMSEDLSLDILADVTGYSTYHLCRLFKKSTGTTLNKYIVNKRIDTAKVYLGTNMDIQSISEKVGFNNYNHFYRCFKQVVGVNPTEYKDMLQNNDEAGLERLRLTYHNTK